MHSLPSPTRNTYLEMASAIFSINKGKQKKVDRPNRHCIWKKMFNASPLPTERTVGSPTIHDSGTITASQQPIATPQPLTITTHYHGRGEAENTPAPSHEEMKQSSHLATLLMPQAFKRTMTIQKKHQMQKANFVQWRLWSNAHAFNHTRNLSRAGNTVLAGFYPRDFIKWRLLYQSLTG